MGKFRTASLDALPEDEDELLPDPLNRERTHYSPCRRYRYTWFRHWGDPNDYACLLAMNPSGATASTALDRTVLAWSRLAKKRGHGAAYVLNACALRSTKPDALFEVADPVGPDNDRWLRAILPGSKMVLAGWGRPIAKLGRHQAVLDILKECCAPERVWCYGFNEDGTPTHPRYQATDAPLHPFFGQPALLQNPPVACERLCRLRSAEGR